MLDELLYFNGINAATGEPLLPPLTPAELTKVARGETFDPADLADLKEKRRTTFEDESSHGVIAGIDSNDLAQTGWGIITAAADADEIPAILDALKPLLDLRREQAGDRYREYLREKAFRPDETKNSWLGRAGGEPGPVDPAKVPYYLLIVGSPEAIPFRFQYQLDVQFAVGRIHFEGADRLDRYARYAESVVAAETGKTGGQPWSLPRRAAFFAASNEDDRATQLSASYLVTPLAQYLAADQPSWQVQSFLGEQATKERLGRLLGGEEAPALVFTASHGMGFPLGHDLQLRHQGALLCSDWPGPRRWRQEIPESFYLSADDVGEDARVMGLIAFHFACYGAGTPRLDDYTHRTGSAQRAEIAPHDFLARLPQRLIGHPKGGALAVVGHVERAWGYSFLWDGYSNQLNAFKSTLKDVAEGYRIGFAIEFFNERYAELSTMLNTQIEDLKFGATANEQELAGLWTANNDARSYVIIGDPAVKLPLGETGAAPADRPALVVETRSQPAASTPAPAALGAVAPAGTALAPLAAATAALAPGEAAAFGLLDRDALRDARDRLVQAVQEFASRLGNALERAVDNASSLEVSTFVSEDMTQVPGNFDQVTRLRAYTRINFDGDTKVCVPETQGEIDKDLWAIHLDMVRQAQANRAEMIRAAVAAAGSLLDVLKVA